MGYYSHSKIASFEQCPYKFKLRYIDKIKPEIEKSIEAHLGTCVHDTLEWIYTEVKEKNISPQIEEMLIYFTEKWKENYNEDIVIVKDLSPEDYYNKGIKFLIDYHQKYSPFRDGTLELEKRITLNLGENNEHKITGFIDRLVFNPTTEEYEIHDYKTANTLPTKEKIEEDRQLALYSIAIKESFGNSKKVKLVWHYLAHNTRIESRRTDEQLEQLKKEILTLIKKIETAKDFPRKRSILCKWCEYQNICKEKAIKELKESPDNNNSNSYSYQNKYPTISKYLKD
jgi:putative RecB family exonuclease